MHSMNLLNQNRSINMNETVSPIEKENNKKKKQEVVEEPAVWLIISGTNGIAWIVSQINYNTKLSRLFLFI